MTARKFRGAFPPDSWHDEDLPITGDLPEISPEEIESIKQWAYKFQTPARLIQRLHDDLVAFQRQAGGTSPSLAVPRDPAQWIKAWAVKYGVWNDRGGGEDR